MFGRCALRLRQCIPFACKRGVLSRRGAGGPGSLVARHRQVHAPCEVEIGNGHKRRSARQADRDGVLRYKGARRKRVVHRKRLDGPKTRRLGVIRSILLGRSFRNKSPKEMAFPHPEPRKDHYRKEEKPVCGGVVRKSYKRTKDIP